MRYNPGYLKSAAAHTFGAALLFTSLLLLCSPLPSHCANSPPPAAFLLAVDGKVIEVRNEHLKLAPASLTKMMTVLLALEKSPLTEEVKITRAAERETGTTMGLKGGEVLRVADLAAGAVVGSANDAARALAVHIGGSEENFVKLMNLRAKALGMVDTTFTNASGHDNPRHLSTAADLLILARAAMENPDYAFLAGRVELTVGTKSGREIRLINKNELIGRFDGAVGVKTGTTPRAGKSLAAMAKRDGHTVVLILLGAQERWFLAEELLERGFKAAGEPP